GRESRAASRSRDHAFRSGRSRASRFLAPCSSLPGLALSALALAFALLRLAGFLLRLALARAASGMRLERGTALRTGWPAAARCGLAARRQQFEAQRACDRGCFNQPDVDDVTELMHGAAARADQGVAALVIVEIFRAQRPDRDQAVCTGISQLDEQAGARDAGDA